MMMPANQHQAALDDRIVRGGRRCSTIHLPMPGHEKIVSVRIAPASMTPIMQADRGDDLGIMRVAQRMNANDAEGGQSPWRGAVRT